MDIDWSDLKEAIAEGKVRVGQKLDNLIVLEVSSDYVLM